MFNQKVYHASVAENVQLYPPAAVLQVNANDADDGAFGEIKYTLLSDDNTLFQLDPNSGILYPSKSLKGMEGQYKLRVEARDGLGAGPFTDEADIIVNIHRINNYRPVFITPALSNTSVEVHEVNKGCSLFFFRTRRKLNSHIFNSESSKRELFGDDCRGN